MKWPEKSKKSERDTTTTIISKRGMTSSERATTPMMLSMPFSLRFDTILFVNYIIFLKSPLQVIAHAHTQNDDDHRRVNKNVLRSRRPRRQSLFEREDEPVQISVQTNRPRSSRFVSVLSLSFQTSFHLTNSLLIINRTILTTFFVFLWRTIQHLMHTKSLLFVGLYPITGATYLFLVMPLATCFAFPEDLPANVNPLKPKDYAFLIKKTWFAMKRNNFKVEGKDL